MLDELSRVVRKGQTLVMQRSFARATEGHRLVLLGDSLTYGLGKADHFDNFGVNGETSTGLLRSMYMYNPAIGRAFATSVLIGTNDIWQNKFAGLEERLELLSSVIPQSKFVLWNTIPPFPDSDVPQQVNKHIKRIVKARGRNTRIVDTWEVLTSSECFLEDRIHLSPYGYKKWTGALVDTMFRP